MSLSPASFSGETSGALARAADSAAPSQQEVQLAASGDKVTGGRRRKSARKGGRKSARKGGRKSLRKSDGRRSRSRR
jgi:hypothetical protein